ncbi:MAG: CcmD family protein [Calditrichaceae bacterium]|nr:CcmD family protein [Calditrichaceae bacterium]MBN2709391.1 CcmD family protein [Calditrichaceae bacterium]RQV95764.1 MAG: CcmD family protein [Calditrichota bacterium]
MEPVYVVLFINLVIWTGLFVYLYKINNQVRKLNGKLQNLQKK